MEKLKVVYFGTPDFSVPCLDLLYHHPLIELSYVVSMPDRPAGRGNKLHTPEVAKYAQDNKIPLLQTSNINKEEKFLNELSSLGIDIFIVLAFAQFLSESSLCIPSKGCYNIHTSLLPRYRGAAPIQHAILNDDSTTGVSIQKMVKEMDAGDVSIQKEVAISKNETGGLLYTRLKYLATECLNDFINQIFTNKLSFTPQDKSKVSFAPSLKKAQGLIDFKYETAEVIESKVRAFTPWPGTYCFLNKKRLKIISLKTSKNSLRPGEISTESGIEVGCHEGTVKLLYVQLEGKKICSAQELINGFKGEILIHS